MPAADKDMVWMRLPKPIRTLVRTLAAVDDMSEQAWMTAAISEVAVRRAKALDKLPKS